MAKELKFEIKEQLGILSETESGWKKEVNMISWNGAEPKIDIRTWDESHTKMGKGITLTDEEATTLLDILHNR